MTKMIPKVFETLKKVETKKMKFDKIKLKLCI